MADSSAGRAAAVAGFSLVRAVLLTVVALTIAGCKVSSQSGVSVHPMSQRSARKHAMTAEQLQARLMSYADRYMARMAEAVDDVLEHKNDPDSRDLALATRYYPSLAVVTIAAQPHPEIGLLDIITVVTLERMVWSDGWAVSAFGPEAALFLTRAQEEMESDAWHIAADLLPEKQLNQLRETIVSWRKDHPERRFVSNMRFDQFAAHRASKGNTGFSIDFGPAMLLAPVDDTAKAVTETRLLGERFSFLIARMPTLIGWQVEMVAGNIATSREASQLLANANSITATAAELAATANALPERLVEAQRKVLVDVDDRAANLKAIAGDVRASVDGANRAADTVRAALTEWRAAAGVTREAAEALEALLRAADVLSARWRPEEAPAKPSTNATGTAAPEEPPTRAPGPLIEAIPEAMVTAASGERTLPSGRPFDIVDYSKAASHLADAARELNRLADNSDKIIGSQAVDRRVRELNDSATEWVDHAYRRATHLALLLAGLIVVTFVTIRMLNRILPRRT